MSTQEDLEDLHARLRKAKSLEKLSFKKLGESIGYSNEGMNKAMRNSTLSAIQIEKVVSEFKLQNYFNNLIKEESPYKDTSEDVKHLADLVYNNWEELKETPLLKTKIELEFAKLHIRFNGNEEKFQAWLANR